MDRDRVTLGSTAELTQVFYSGTDPIDADDDVTVTVYDTTGEVVSTGLADPGATDSGEYSYSDFIPAQVDRCTVKWVGTFDGNVQTVWTRADVVSARYFSLAALRNTYPAVEDENRFPVTALAEARLWAEERAEEIMGKSYVIQVAKKTVNVSDSTWAVRLLQPVRHVRTVQIDGANTTYTLGGGVQGYLTDLRPNETIDIIYEHGEDEVDRVLSDAVMMLAATKATQPRSAIPNRAERWQPDGNSGMFQLAMAGADRTGIPEVDAILQSKRAPAIA